MGKSLLFYSNALLTNVKRRISLTLYGEPSYYSHRAQLKK